jgi:hypothetical protein
MTMKMTWPDLWNSFWDTLAERIKEHGVHFLAGDFNMSLTEVCKQLRKRGLQCDCVTWYPWRIEGDILGQTNTAIEDLLKKQRLGFDSCGIFYIGGPVEVKMDWGFNDISLLSAVAEQDPTTGEYNDPLAQVWVPSGENWRMLQAYSGTSPPGQPWTCFRSKKEKETADQKNLKERLEDLLEPTTTEEELANIQRRPGQVGKPFLRLKGKLLKEAEWLVEGEHHKGAHFPLAMWTNNVGFRSEEKSERRKTKFDERRKKHCRSPQRKWA